MLKNGAIKRAGIQPGTVAAWLAVTCKLIATTAASVAYFVGNHVDISYSRAFGCALQ